MESRKKYILILLLLFFVTGNSLFANSIEKPLRSKTNLDREWKFQLGDFEGAEKANFDDNSWQNVGLPHSFSLPYFLSAEFYTGYGWYRKQLVVDREIGGRRFSLEFEGVFQVAELFVNGVRAGEHRGGYNGFSIDITKVLHKGNNVIAVRVNNIWDAQLAPRAGEHVFSGGIYRDVWLVETAPVHVDWYGTFVTTPELSEKSGKVNIKTEISNDGNPTAKGILKTDIYSPSGMKVASMKSPFSLAAGNTVTLEQTSSAINNPELWTPETPFLYKAVSTILQDNVPVDSFETTFGMRWIEWTADKGFFLNGKHRYFKGANVHQDHAGWGDGVTNAGFVRDVQLMKDAGFDFIRGSHYPHDPAFSEACDKLGMLFWSENCFWGIGGFKPEGDWSCSAYPTIEKDEKPFEESVKESLREMIRIHRNHPSIIVWSMSNEPFFTVSEQMPKVREFLKELVELTHELDPTRPAAIGGCQRGEIDTIGDVAGYNGDGARLYIDPGVASIVAEYGSTIADRPGEYIAGYGELQEEQFEWRSGQAIWCGFDHGSIAGHFGCMGIMDYFRLPKRQWFWYRNEYKGILHPDWAVEGVPAAVRLTADKNIIEHADGTDDVHLIASILDKDGKELSNSPDVKLEIVSGPGEFPTGSSILFQNGSDIVIRDGKAAIEFRSYYAGETVIRASSPGLESAEITIVSKAGPAYDPQNSKVTSIPYIRYRNEASKTQGDAEINLVAERPTRVSSSSDGHSPRLANDGTPSTYWEAASGSGKAAWWQVDMENIYSVKKVALTFNKETALSYAIEISMDDKSWQRIVEPKDNETAAKSRTEEPTADIFGRFMRISFEGAKSSDVPNIAEIEVYGVSKSK